MTPEPEENTVWQHHNGNTYVVLFLTNDPVERQEEYPRTVVYKNAGTGTRYSRKLSDWYRSMTPYPSHPNACGGIHNFSNQDAFWTATPAREYPWWGWCSSCGAPWCKKSPTDLT